MDISHIFARFLPLFYLLNEQHFFKVRKNGMWIAIGKTQNMDDKEKIEG
jgi:hypothetical protein